MKRVLLAVCGLSPQVITETLYALHQQGRMPHAIRILTTREGKGAINARLLAPEDGAYYQFCADYEIPTASVDFSHRHITAVRDQNGNEIADIAGEEDNEAFLRACMEAAFDLTSDPETEVYFSIAGGRKTMGACLTLAAQFYGRPKDRIFHVLVSPEFESCRDFYYPPKESRPMILRDDKGQPYSKESRYAVINLIPMPFISVRDRLAGLMLKEPEQPATLMMSLVQEKKAELVIDLCERKVIWKGIEHDIMPARLALYAFFALRKKDAVCGNKSCRDCDACFLTVIEVMESHGEVSALYRRTGCERLPEEMSSSGVQGLSQENFNSYKTRIRRDLEQGFGVHDTRLLEIASAGKRPGVRYGIRLERERIRVVM